MEPVVCLLPQVRALSDADNVHAGRSHRRWRCADLADLLDLTVDLCETEPVRECRGAFVLNDGRDLGMTLSLAMPRQGQQQGCASAAAPGLGQDPRADKSAPAGPTCRG